MTTSSDLLALVDSGDPAFTELADLAAALLGAPIAAVTMLDATTLHVLGAHGAPTDPLPRDLALCDTTVRTARPLVVPALGKDERFASHVARSIGVQAYAGAPVHDADGTVVGTLCVLDTKERAFSTLQVQALVTLASQVTTLVVLRQRERQLRVTGEALSAAIVQSPVGIVTIAQRGPRTGKLLGANPALCRLLGRTADELAQLGCHDITHPEDVPASDALVADLVSGRVQTGRGTKRFLRPGGQVVWAEVTATVLHDAVGEPEQVLFHCLDVTDRMAREAELVSLALQDPLTGLPNRTHLVERLSSLPTDRETVLVYLDLDGFKPVNDNLGHAVGDQVLVRLAERMRGALRAGDLLCRVGGDEFVAVLTSDLPSARSTAQRLLDVLAEPVTVGPARVSLGASAGLAAVTSGWEAALEAADAAMYAAKRSEAGLREAV